MCPADDWIHHADDLVRVTPLREVELTTRPKTGRNYDPLQRRASYWFFHGQGGKTKTAYRNYFGIHDCESFTRREDPDEWGIGELLTVNWPGIKFTLPPAPSYPTPGTVFQPANDGTVYEHPGADHEIQVGDYVVQDGHGRLVRTDSRAGAAGIALSRMDANGMVRVRLVDDSTMQLHQNAAEAQRLRQMMERPFAGPLVDLDLDEPPH